MNPILKWLRARIDRGSASSLDPAGRGALTDEEHIVTEEEIRAALREVIDPEVGINVVDLGLIYGIKIQGLEVTVDMTMTTAACPMGDMMQADAEAAIRDRFPEAKVVNVALVWNPPWAPEMMSDTARQTLGWSR